MEHFRLKKYRGPEVWARVRRAYEAGESGPSVAQRFDVGLANLRKKAREGGWSRRHQAERSDRDLPPERATAPRLEAQEPIDREEALAACLDHAATAMARGDGPAALSALKAARAYTELTGQVHDPDGTEPGRWRAIEALCQTDAVAAKAHELAEAMLAGTPRGAYGETATMYHWRAEHLGPEIAARDYARALETGRAHHYWDEDGVLRPLDGEVGEWLRRMRAGAGGGEREGE